MPLPLFRWLRACVCAGVLAAPSTAIADGLLDDVRREVSEDDDDDRSDRNYRHRDWDDDCEDDTDDSFTDAITAPIRFTVTAPWWLPHLALEDNWDTQPEFPTAPYADGHSGYLLIDSPSRGPTRDWSARATALYGTDFGDLSWYGTRMVLDSASRFGIDASWNQWIEQRPAGEDSLSTGDVNLVVRFAQGEQVQFYSGLGANWLADHGSGDAGFNFTYGLDWFPQRPWVVSASFDAGTLGGARFFHGQFGIGAVWNRVELVTGYDVTQIGDVTLNGLFGGVRLWF